MEVVLDFGIVFSLVSINDETERSRVEIQSLFKQESRSQKCAVINGIRKAKQVVDFVARRTTISVRERFFLKEISKLQTCKSSRSNKIEEVMSKS